MCFYTFSQRFGRVQYLRAPCSSLASSGQSVRQVTAAYGHFGRKPYTENGMKFFEWENTVDLTKCALADFSQRGVESFRAMFFIIFHASGTFAVRVS